MSTNLRSAEFNGVTVYAVRMATKFVSLYSKVGDKPEDGYLTVEHRTENAARKGSWQSKEMRKVWVYRGYVAI